MKDQTKDETPIPDAQTLLTFGYLYLILLGILNEVFFYNQVGINILKYSTIMDVLLSPIAILTSNFIPLIIFTAVLFAVFLGPAHISKNRTKKWITSIFSPDTNLSDKQVERHYLKSFLFMLSVGLLGFFVGTGLGKGLRYTKKISKNEVQYDDKLTFVDGGKEKVKILGNNSNYIFYLLEGESVVKITPVNGVIKRIEDVKTKKN